MVEWAIFGLEAFIITCLQYPAAKLQEVPSDKFMNETNKENENSIYETGFHLIPSIDESEVPAQASKVRSIIEENGGVVISEETPKMIVLAYNISKNINSKNQSFNKAYFGWIKFEVDPSQANVIKGKVEALENVLRFLIVKTVRESTVHTPKVPTFKKEVRDEKTEGSTEKHEASEEEIDKSIDELVIDQNL